MRLKQIKLAGFKSFVDPTVAQFPDNLTAIVGPNGCGKSNIIDAVRWVMGESSAKHLRGDSMADVIFNGSSARKPVAQASVELVFDNSEGKLEGEYAQYNEISTKRLVTREGQSIYSLNGSRCRRKDITDLFLGTGLGPRSYAIIEQGMISRLIESKPMELRVFIEEAAGISKYKERRRETENRIRHSRENLDRLNDLREELGKQLDHLQRQANAAEKYKSFKAEERQLKAELAALRWRSLDRTLSEGQRYLSELEVELEAKVAGQRGVDRQLEEAREQHISLSDHFNKVQAQYYQIGSDIARLEQNIEHSKNRKVQLKDDLENAKTELANGQAHQADDIAKGEEIAQELLELEPELELAQESLEEGAIFLAEQEDAMQNWQGAWDDFTTRSADNQKQAELLKTRISHGETLLTRLQARIQTLAEEQRSLADDQGDETVMAAIAQLKEEEAVVEELQEQVKTVFEEVENLRQTAKAKTAELKSAQSHWQSLDSKHQALKAVQEAALSSGDKDQSAWLAANNLENAPRLAQHIQVEPKWAQAVETVLGDKLEALCIDKLADLSELNWEYAGGSFIEKASTPAAGSQFAESANDSLAAQITSDFEISGTFIAETFGGILLADNLEQAFAKRATLGAGQTVITPEGYWLGQHWLRIGRKAASGDSIIEREAAIQTLEEELAVAKAALEERELEAETLSTQTAEAEQKRKEKQLSLNEKSASLSKLQAQVGAQQARMEQIEKRRVRIEQEVEENQLQAAEEQERLAENRIALEAVLDNMAGDEALKERLQSEREEKRAQLNNSRQKAKDDKEHHHRIAIRAESLKAEQATIAKQQARTAQQILQLTSRIESLSLAMAENDEPVTEMEMALEEQLTSRLVIEEQLNAAREETEALEHRLRQLDKDRLHHEQNSQAIREKLERSRLECQGLVMQKSTQEEHIGELEAELQATLDALPENAAEAEWVANLEKIAGRIARLGAINLAAIEEYQTQSERKTYLDSQNDDLLAALETLENAIRKIDKETKQRFQETFDKINSGIQELFPKVFGGGHAYLELTGDDLLDTGVAIMARPPGKKNSTIHLLSGGEKALTALSLVFSIFRLNPAPFCLLDEVDAPLDDANVGRFCKLVREMSTQVQFIYISHNKVTMEMANHMQGVTMHEPGVSRLVSVDIDEAAQLVNA